MGRKTLCIYLSGVGTFSFAFLRGSVPSSEEMPSLRISHTVPESVGLPRVEKHIEFVYFCHQPSLDRQLFPILNPTALRPHDIAALWPAYGAEVGDLCAVNQK
jgi:hypothetical protein